MNGSNQIFDTVSHNHLNFFNSGREFQAKKVVEFLSLSYRDLSQLSGVAESSVRLDDRIPGPLKERLIEIATVCENVAAHFKGDVQKTALWFAVPNPLLGNLSPKDMIRFGRFKKLMKFIGNAMAGNHP